MSEDTRNDAPEGEAGADRPEDARRNRTIRFSDSEWEEVRRAALVHDTPPAEFVRETILALARNPESGEFRRCCAVAGAADRADVPLHLVPGDREARRDGPRRPRRRARRAGRGGPHLARQAAPGRCQLSLTVEVQRISAHGGGNLDCIAGDQLGRQQQESQGAIYLIRIGPRWHLGTTPANRGGATFSGELPVVSPSPAHFGMWRCIEIGPRFNDKAHGPLRSQDRNSSARFRSRRLPLRWVARSSLRMAASISLSGA